MYFDLGIIRDAVGTLGVETGHTKIVNRHLNAGLVTFCAGEREERGGGERFHDSRMFSFTDRFNVFAFQLLKNML